MAISIPQSVHVFPEPADASPGAPAGHHGPEARRTRWAFEPGADLAPGRRILEPLGGGDRYEAYVVWDDLRLAPLVAKVLRPHLVDVDRARQAMAREVEALEALSHPALVRSFGADLGGPRPHLLLDFLEGPRLSTLVRRFGPMSAEQVVLLGRRVAPALQYMAAMGWVHLDVKPRNIVIGARPTLIDLSVARPFAAARSSVGVGTAAYMAPEQIVRSRISEIGPPADVFGLGATLFEALTARQAFAPLGAERFPQLRPDRPVLPAPKTPPLLASIVRRALDDRPERRPTAEEIYDELDDLAGWAGKSARRIR